MSIQALQAIVGKEHVLQGDDALPFLKDWRGRYKGEAFAVVKPENEQEVAELVKCCRQYDYVIVPQGGNTSLCGGATATQSNAVVISLVRLNQVLSIDTDNDTITVQAGCLLQTVQEQAEKHNRLFPLSLAAEGSCTIGGNLATNAGGTQVLRYGNARELTLGLQVVTAEGEVWNGLRGLRKDNTGYDLKDLYIGSEGTLGIITAATLKLFPQPAAQCTALLAFQSFEDAVTMLSKARTGFAAALTAYEVISNYCLNLVPKVFEQQRLPFEGESLNCPWYALLELSDSESQEHAREQFERVVGQAIEEGIVQDAVIAESVAQSQALWHLRESIPLAEGQTGKAVKNDISIPVSHIAEFIRTTNAALQENFPACRHIIFGHLGDGNLHYNVGAPEGSDEAAFLAKQADVFKVVFDSVQKFNGSISAEHGIGQLKVNWMAQYKDSVEVALMHRIKQALDPQNRMNPGKVLAA